MAGSEASLSKENTYTERCTSKNGLWSIKAFWVINLILIKLVSYLKQGNLFEQQANILKFRLIKKSFLYFLTLMISVWFMKIVFLPPLHIKLGPMKTFVKVINDEGAVFMYLKVKPNQGQCLPRMNQFLGNS